MTPLLIFPYLPNLEPLGALNLVEYSTRTLSSYLIISCFTETLSERHSNTEFLLLRIFP